MLWRRMQFPTPARRAESAPIIEKKRDLCYTTIRDAEKPLNLNRAPAAEAERKGEHDE